MELNLTDNIHYYFAIVTVRDGTNWPIIRVHDTGIFRLVEHLGSYELQNSDYVRKFIEKIDEEIKNHKDHSTFWIHHRHITIEITGYDVKIFEDSPETEYCVLTVNGLKKILSQWNGFLKAYENGGIPGIMKKWD